MNIQAVIDAGVRNAPKAEPVSPVTVPGEPRPAPQDAVPAVQDQPVEAAAEDPAREDVEKVLDGINTFLGSGNNHIQFSLHQEAQRLMVQVIDNETQEVVRTFPPKELLDLAARIGEMVGTLIDETG